MPQSSITLKEANGVFLPLAGEGNTNGTSSTR